MKIYIARHGKDEEGYRGGWSERGLTTTGIRQVERLAEHIYHNREHYSIKSILSSDLIRAKETAKLVGKKLGYEIQYIKELREMNNGDLAGMNDNDANRLYPGIYFNTLEMDEGYPNGESPSEFYKRINNYFTGLMTEVENRELESNVLLITHGGVINIIHYIIKKLEWSNKAKPFPSKHTSLYCIDYSEGTWVIATEEYDYR